MEESKEAMKNTENKTAGQDKKEFKWYAAKRIILGVALTIVGLWIFSAALGYFEGSSLIKTKPGVSPESGAVHEKSADTQATEPSEPPTDHGQTPVTEKAPEPAVAEHKEEKAVPGEEHGRPAPHEQAAASGKGHGPTEPASGPAEAAGHAAVPAEAPAYRPKGYAFINAIMKPMDYELNERFYGWRPNDILDFTDNVNNYQLGVLEVTRRTAVALAERISRTGSTAAFDKNLENAMNWFMIKADRYWFPSPESKYKAGLEELKKYQEKLLKGESNFYTRTDNLIPLLMAYEDLLGSCDDNLVKTKEDDGSSVSHFKSDDYFYWGMHLTPVTAIYSMSGHEGRLPPDIDRI